MIQWWTVLHGIIILNLSFYDGNYDICDKNDVHDDGVYYDHANLGLGK